MISREQAQEIIKAAKLENPNQILASRIQTLPTKLAKITFDFLKMDSSGQELEWDDYDVEEAFEEAAKKTFLAISKPDFTQVLETWFPRFAPTVMAALHLPTRNHSGFQVSASNDLLEQAELAEQWLGYLEPIQIGRAHV